MAQWFWKKIFLISSMYFCYFVIIFLGKGQRRSFEQTWIVFNQGCLSQVWFNLKIIKFRQCIFTISYLSPFGKGEVGGGGLHLNKLEYSSPKDALCQVWLKLAHWFWRKFLILSMYFRYFIIISLGKGQGLLLNKFESPSPKNGLC